MRGIVKTLPLLAVLAGAGTAHAQDPEGMPAPVAVDPSQQQFDAAFAAMTHGDFAIAAQGFRTVAQTAADPELRGAANQLGRLADDYARRGAKLSLVSAPGLTGATDSISEDDARDGGRATFITTTTIAALYSGVVLVQLSG